MRRPTGSSAFFSLLKSGSAGALALATILSCTDSTSPAEGLDGVIRVRVTSVGPDVPDSVKEAMAMAAQQSESPFMSASMAPLSANVMASASAALSSAGCGSGSEFTGYVKSRVAFSPELSPVYAPFPVGDDKWMPDMPIGFNFSFYGKTYDKVNIYSNGLLVFGAVPSTTNGFPTGGVIASASTPNNILAFAWSDWSPQLVANGIRYETRGVAPNRKYILQFNDVPEFASGQTPTSIKSTSGRVTVQVVLSEGSNDITIYTNKMSLTNSTHRYTQGIENADASDAQFDIIQNPTTLAWVSRVNRFFSKISLTDDAVRFSLIPSAKDAEAPSISAPADITDKGNDPGLASAVVAVGSPVASDNCSDVTVSSLRSDGAAIDAPYPVGTTTISWTATDASGNAASATQTIIVLDKEAPVFDPSAQSILTVNATSPAGAVVSFNPTATDNVKVTSLSCEPASGSLFPAGQNSDVSCSASDAAGNTSWKLFSVFVVNAQQQMETLMGEVADLPLKNGTSQPLINQLESAYRENGNECKKVSDFIDMVSKKGSSINPLDAKMLIESALDIMGALGCEGVPTVKAQTPGASNLLQFLTSLRQ